MPRRFLILVLILLFAATPLTVQAQTPATPPLPDQNGIIHFATEYTQTVMLGVIGGGILMNVLVGGGGATLAGALAGSSLASWLFVSLHARNYVIQRTAPHQTR